MFTKHFEYVARLRKLAGMFSCEFREGRPTSAPSLKKAGEPASLRAPGPASSASLRALNPGQVLSLLPHQYPDGQIRRMFPEATAPEDALGKSDHPPEGELSDPVPALQRRGAAAVRDGKAAVAEGAARVIWVGLAGLDAMSYNRTNINQ